MKLKIENGRNDSLSIKNKEEIQVIFLKPMYLLIISKLNRNIKLKSYNKCRLSEILNLSNIRDNSKKEQAEVVKNNPLSKLSKQELR
jgi:hypothetical protein